MEETLKRYINNIFFCQKVLGQTYLVYVTYFLELEFVKLEF